jgi:hypothetical protein
MNDEEIIQRVLSHKTPLELQAAKIKRVKRTITFIAFLNVLGFLMFFPYEPITGYSIIDLNMPPVSRVIILAITFVTITFLLWLQMKQLAKAISQQEM